MKSDYHDHYYVHMRLRTTEFFFNGNILLPCKDKEKDRKTIGQWEEGGGEGRGKERERKI